MKKSTRLLMIGICIIILSFVADVIISDTFIDMTDPSAFGIVHYACIVLAGVLVIAGIVLIVISRKMSKKGK